MAGYKREYRREANDNCEGKLQRADHVCLLLQPEQKEEGKLDVRENPNEEICVDRLEA